MPAQGTSPYAYVHSKSQVGSNTETAFAVSSTVAGYTGTLVSGSIASAPGVAKPLLQIDSSTATPFVKVCDYLVQNMGR